MNCTKFKCLVQAVGFSKQIRLFRLTGSIDLAMLDSIFGAFNPTNFSHLRLRNDLKLVLPDSLIDVYQDTDDSNFDDPSILSAVHSVYLTIRQIPGHEKIALWIIVSSVLAGMFILSLLIVSLVKVRVASKLSALVWPDARGEIFDSLQTERTERMPALQGNQCEIRSSRELRYHRLVHHGRPSHC